MAKSQKPVSRIGWIMRLRASVKSRGLRGSLQTVISMFEDVWFDHRHGIDTAGEIRLSALGFESEHKSRGAKYIGTRLRSFRKVMATLDLPPDSNIVDFGCGKG